MRAIMSTHPLIVKLEDREWDIASADRLSRLLAPAVTHENVVIDMSNVDYIDSSCLGKLMAMRKERVEARGGAPARIVVTSPTVRRVFSIVQFDRLWPVFESVDAAIADVESARAEDRERDGSRYAKRSVRMATSSAGARSEKIASLIAPASSPPEARAARSAAASNSVSPVSRSRECSVSPSV